MPPDTHIGAIAGSRAVERLLSDVCTSRALLHIHLEGNESRQFVTRFKELEGEGSLIVDPLLFDGEGASLSSLTHVTVSFVFKFNKYEFETICLGSSTSGLEGVRLALPSAIRKIELRNYFRLHLDDQTVMRVKLSAGNLPDAPMEGRIVDISEGGLSCEVETSVRIEKGEWVNNIQFALPNGYAVVTSGTVKRVSPITNQLWTYGLEFAHLDRTDHFALVDFIFEKQREEIRKKKHLL